MNKLISFYIILIILIALFTLFDVNFYSAFLIKVPFTSFSHKVFEVLTTFVFILIFWKANKLYSQIGDKRMTVIAGGFLAGSFLNIYHLFSTFGALYNVLIFQNLETNPSLLYLVAEKLIIPISIFIAVFYMQKSSTKKTNNFRLITSFFFFCIFILIISLDEFIFPLLSGYAFHKILLFEQSLNVVDEALYFLMSFILVDRKINTNKNIFSKFILGLLVIGIAELFCINPRFLGINEIISHFLKLIGFIFIFLGIENFQLLPDIKSIKQKLLVFLSLFLIMLYITFSLFHLTIIEIYLSSKFSYIFIEFLLISAIIGYIFTTKFSLPLSNIIETMNKYEPGEKSEKIPIISDDEVGELSEKLNEILDREWAYSKELIEKQTKIQELLDKEQLLFKVTNTIRSSLDINETLSIICDEVARVFNVQRATIIEYADKQNYSEWIIKREFKIRPDIKGVTGIEYDIRNIEYIGKTVLDQGKILVNDDISKSNTPDFFKESYKQIGVKSNIGVPIKKGEDKLGILFISEYYYYRHWTENDVILLQNIADQVYIAIKQSELFTAIKEKSEKENLLVKIISAMRSTLDINETKKILVNEIGKTLNADRVFLVSFEPETNTPKILDEYSEYLSSPDQISCVGFDFSSKKVEAFTDLHKQTKPVFIEDVEKHIKENNLQDTPEGQWMIEIKVKTGLGIALFYGKKVYGVLSIHYTKAKIRITDEYIEFIRVVADQAGIALYQANLYETLKKQSEREFFLRKIIETIRSTLNFDEIKHEIVNQIAMLLKADRVTIAYYDYETDNYIISKESEYRSSDNVKTFVGQDFTKNIPGFAEFIRDKHFQGNDIIFNDLEKYLAENNLRGTGAEKFYREYGFASSAAINIYYRKMFLGNLVITFENQRDISDDEINLIKILAVQTGVATYQAKLYETIKEQAENEKILREIISEIKVSQTVEEVYEYIVTKLADIFNTERAFFVEIPALENEKPAIKHQYRKRSDITFIPDYMIQEKCLMNLIETANKEGISIINNTEEHNKDDEKLQNFFKSFNVKSILLVPLIRYNHDIKLLGAFILCSNKVRDWNQDEMNLVKSIVNSTVTVVWEIKKRDELEELRNVFILTLTHDLQVPLVGEHKALEFVTSRPDDQPIGKFRGIITDILKSNEGLTTLLKKLLNSYNFESGKQKLDLSLHHLSIPITEVINSLKDLADSKQISIETQIDENLPSIIMDKEQISQVLHTLLENSITYIQQGGHIIIKSIKEKDKIITCVIDNGPGISYKTRERIFERYAMAIAIERKIGAGLGLYLAKQIIEAHRGKIWYETEIGKGTTFCFSLPLE